MFRVTSECVPQDTGISLPPKCSRNGLHIQDTAKVRAGKTLPCVSYLHRLVQRVTESVDCFVVSEPSHTGRNRGSGPTLEGY